MYQYKTKIKKNLPRIMASKKVECEHGRVAVLRDTCYLQTIRATYKRYVPPTNDPCYLQTIRATYKRLFFYPTVINKK